MITDSPHVLEHGSSRTGRWLRERRTRIALWTAVGEGVLVILLHDFTKWTLIAVSIPLILLYALWGRNSGSDTVRQVTWIAGAAQALAVLFVLVAFVVGLFVIALVVLAAVAAIAFFFIDRR